MGVPFQIIIFFIVVAFVLSPFIGDPNPGTTAHIWKAKEFLN